MDLRLYPKYKDSGVEWLGEIPEHWEIKRLKYPAKLINVKVENENNNLKYIGLENIESWTGNLIESENQIEFEGQANLFKSGDVLFCKLRPYLAKAYQAAEDGLCTSELLVLRPKEVIRSYLFYFLMNPNFIEVVNSSTYGAKMPRANWDFIGDLLSTIPNPEEQTQIASFLDHETSRIDKLIEKKNRQIELLQEKRSALITHAVTKGLNPNAKMKDSGVEWIGEIPEGWEVKRIKRLTKVKRGASPRPIDDPKYFDEEGEYSWVRIADVTASENFLERTTQKLSPLGRQLSVPLEPGDLFLSIAGSVGKPIITKIKCCIHDGFVYFPNYKENNNFLYYIFACGQVFFGLGKMGTQLNLNTDTVGDISIPMPKIIEQSQITDYLDKETTKIDTLISKIQFSIDKLTEFRTALISAAVTGKIDVRNWKKEAAS